MCPPAPAAFYTLSAGFLRLFRQGKNTMTSMEFTARVPGLDEDDRDNHNAAAPNHRDLRKRITDAGETRAPNALNRMMFAKYPDLIPEDLDRATEHALILRAQAGDHDAMMTLVEAHRPILEEIARTQTRDYRQDRRTDMSTEMKTDPDTGPDEDLFEVGIEKFLSAVKRFDTNRQTRLMTFCGLHVIIAMREFLLTTSGLLPIGSTSRERRLREQIDRIRDRFRKTHGREMAETPEDARLALAFFEPGRNTAPGPGMLLDLMEKMRNRQMRDITSVQVVSQDATDYGESMCMTGQMRALVSKHIAAARAHLGKRDAEIFDHIAEDPFDTLLTRYRMARKHGITRERVGQIFNGALAIARENFSKAGIHALDDMM
mgnify:CR=1 FL=1